MAKDQIITIKCPICEGTGTFQRKGLLNGEVVILEEITCPRCDGDGEIQFGTLKKET